MAHQNVFKLILAMLFTGAAIGCGIYAVLPDTPWYKVTSVGGLSIDVETYDSAKGDKMKQLFKVSFSFLYAGIALEGLLLVMMLLFGLLKLKGGKHLRIISVLIAIFGALTFSFGALYFLRHPELCGNAPKIGPCKSFSGSDSLLKWGPDNGWILAIVGSVCAFIALIFASLIRGHHGYMVLK